MARNKHFHLVQNMRLPFGTQRSLVRIQSRRFSQSKGLEISTLAFFILSSTISNYFVSVKVTPKHIPSLQTTFLLYRRKLLLKRHITLLTLDTATRNTGYCVFENGKIIKTGVISTKAKEPLDKMLLKIGTLLTKYQPDIVVCENTVVLRIAKVQ